MVFNDIYFSQMETIGSAYNMIRLRYYKNSSLNPNFGRVCSATSVANFNLRIGLYMQMYYRAMYDNFAAFYDV